MNGDAGLAEAKSGLRRRMGAVLASIDAASRRDAGRRLAEAVRGRPEYGPARLVLAFLSMPAELDTGPAVEAALADGKRVAVPRIEGSDIRFVELTQGWKDWPRDRWGIPAPPASAASLAIAEIAAGPTLALIPGLAFDRAGGRLGRGKGFYDRFLAEVDAEVGRAGVSAPGGSPPRFAAIGLGNAAQLVDAVPGGPFDRSVDDLILV